MRVLVCGGRDFDDKEEVFRVLDEILEDNYNVVIIQGGAKGADSLARQWATVRPAWLETFEADWETHGKFAGPFRNQQMLESGVDLAVAFKGGRGTMDMVKRLEKAGIEVRKVGW